MLHEFSWRWHGLFVAIAALTGCVSVAAFGAAEPYDPVAAGELPRYVLFNFAPGVGWNQANPSSIAPALLADITGTINRHGHSRLRVGGSFILSLLENDAATLKATARRIMECAEATDVPIMITLDGQNWWQSRSDLWNWWDPSLPGYDPANSCNVEWTGWSPEHAVKIGWRNWGSQIRVRPAPNLASPAILAEIDARYEALIPIVLQWYSAPPADRKYLFAGLKLGWEASINVNAYYHTNGNQIFEQYPNDASHDPTNHDPALGWTFGHEPPLGYNAVRTATGKSSGELTKADIEFVVRQYLEHLCIKAAALGAPPHMVFTHQGGTFAPWDQHLSFLPAVNDWSVPGWSFYSHDPAESGSLAGDLASAGRQQWFASEWWRGAANQAGWVDRFRATLYFGRCRGLCVYNWNSFKSFPVGVAAVRQLVDEAEHDCNGNGLPDAYDIVGGAADCDRDAVPDVCENDADADGCIDPCDACPGTRVGVPVDSNGCAASVRPDFDHDGDVDQSDFGHLQACMSGFLVPQNEPACQDAKLDADRDVDRSDVAIFRRCLSGSGNPAAPNCAN